METMYRADASGAAKGGCVATTSDEVAFPRLNGRQFASRATFTTRMFWMVARPRSPARGETNAHPPYSAYEAPRGSPWHTWTLLCVNDKCTHASSFSSRSHALIFLRPAPAGEASLPDYGYLALFRSLRPSQQIEKAPRSQLAVSAAFNASHRDGQFASKDRPATVELPLEIRVDLANPKGFRLYSHHPVVWPYRGGSSNASVQPIESQSGGNFVKVFASRRPLV